MNGAKKSVEKAIIYMALVLGAFSCMLPFLWMLSTSLKANNVVFEIPPQWIPKELMWENYSKAVTVIPFFRYTLNTSIITILRLVGEIFISALVAFGFARYKFRGKKLLFIILLATIMVPGEVTLIPMFIFYKHLHWIDTILPLTVSAFLGGSAIYIFLMRQFFMTIPKELHEAARIDGYGEFDIFSKIYLPLSKPAIAAIAIFSFQGSWNDFLGPLIYLNTQEKFTLQIGLQMYHSLNKVDWNLTMAASLLVLMPVLFLFFAAQKYFIEGITVTGIKG